MQKNINFSKILQTLLLLGITCFNSKSLCMNNNKTESTFTQTTQPAKTTKTKPINPIIAHTKVLKELKKYNNKKNKQNKPEKTISDNTTQTESFLNIWFNQKEKPTDYSDLIEKILLDSYTIEGDNLILYKNLIKSMIKEEKKHPDCYVFYHTYDAYAEVAFKIQTAIAKWLELKSYDSKDIYLRLKKEVEHDHIKGFFKDYYNKFYNTKFPDHCEPMRSQVLAVNLCPFGNTGVMGESSLEFLTSDFSISNPINSLNNLFDIFGFQKQYIDKLLFLYHLLIKNYKEYKQNISLQDKSFNKQFNNYNRLECNKNILQLFIPKNKVDNFVYLSERYGKPIDNNYQSKEKHEYTSKFLEKYINDPYSLTNTKNNTKKIINRTQARIVFMPDFYDYDKESEIKTFKYNFLEQEKKDQYKKDLEKIIDQMMQEWFEEKGYEKMPENEKNRKFIKLINFIKNDTNKDFSKQL